MAAIDRSDIIAIIALVLSVGAFGVSVYEARILRNQFELMQDEKKQLSGHI